MECATESREPRNCNRRYTQMDADDLLGFSEAEIEALRSSAFHLGIFLVMVKLSCAQWGAPAWVTSEPAADPGP